MTVHRPPSPAFDPFARPDGSCLGRRPEEDEPPEPAKTTGRGTPPTGPAEPMKSGRPESG